MQVSLECPAAAPRLHASATAAPQPQPQAHLALAAFGDAVALIDRSGLAWTSPGWCTLMPQLPAGSTLLAVTRALPGFPDAGFAAGDRDDDLGASDTAAPAARRLLLGAAGEWEAQLAPQDEGRWLLRLCDRREQSRVLQRQLDDREQLLFTSRVISVGEMATTLAHELNQPIGAAANLLRGLRARFARRRLEAEESEALDRSIEQVMFASKVIARIREFTHSHQPRHARVDLVALVRASASLLDWDLRRSGARLSLSLPDTPVAVRGDEVMLQQVIVNLMRNALDALRSDPPEAPRLSLRLLVQAREAELQVQDNGCGLADDAAAKLFVPFASSKPNGMGIGLSICRSFVELHQGRLWFSRPPVRGATFHLGLPLLACAGDPSNKGEAA